MMENGGWEERMNLGGEGGGGRKRRWVPPIGRGYTEFISINRVTHSGNVLYTISLSKYPYKDVVKQRYDTLINL